MSSTVNEEIGGRVAWASDPLAGSQRMLDALGASVPISLIATFDLQTCNSHRPVGDILNDAVLSGFDYVPVVNSEGAIIGLFERTLASDAAQSVGDAMTPLQGSHLISADAGILSFVETVDSFPYALVLSGRQIQGIVTLSDLQKLAVRPVLFALITYVELLLASFIRRRCESDEQWLSLLTPERQRKIERKWRRLRAADMAIDRVTTTDFFDKRIAAVAFGAFAQDSHAGDALREVEDLRHAVAHAGDYAITPDSARRVARTVRTARSLIGELYPQVYH